MTLALVLLLVVPPGVAIYLAQDWLERRRRAKRGWTDDADPMSWRSPRDALILLTAGTALVVGAVCVFAIRSSTG